MSLLSRFLTVRLGGTLYIRSGEPPANNKPYGRIAAFRIIADRLGRDVSLEPRPIHPDLLEEAKQTLRLSVSDIERASQPHNKEERDKRHGPKG